jgi:hypothetical protein
MSDLRIDAAFLNALAAEATLAAGELAFAGWQFRAPADHLQSDSVAAALAAGSAQQLARARLLEALVIEAGDYPATAARRFLATDARLARTDF